MAKRVGSQMAVYNASGVTLNDGDETGLFVDADGGLLVSMVGAIAGEDVTNDVLKVEQRYSLLLVAADQLVKTGGGFIHTVTFSCNDAAPTAGTIDIYDSTSATGTKIYSETFDTTAFRGHTITLDGEFSTGLYIDFTTTADINATVSYR